MFHFISFFLSCGPRFQYRYSSHPAGPHSLQVRLKCFVLLQEIALPPKLEDFRSLGVGAVARIARNTVRKNSWHRSPTLRDCQSCCRSALALMSFRSLHAIKSLTLCAALACQACSEEKQQNKLLLKCNTSTHDVTPNNQY